MTRNSKNFIYGSSRLFWIGTGLMFIYYISDSAMDALLFGDETFAVQFFSPSPHELAIRVLSGTFFFAFFLFARHLLLKNQLLQQKLLEQTQELVASTQEREAFTYSVSHELRTSLTCIYLAEQTFTELHSDDLNGEGLNLINHIHDTCEKMSSQIDKILDLSKVIRADLKFKHIELNKLVLDVADEVSADINDMTLCLNTENKMPICCDPELMHLAIRSLCLNIVEYCKPIKRADISIGTVETREEQQTFFIRNNVFSSCRDGQEHHRTLFDLGSKAKGLPGSCVYMNVAEAVIQRHGGSLWAESTPESEGTIFFSI